MILWTVQDMAACERLQEEGLLQGDGRWVEPYHHHAYQWVAEQMHLRLPPPHSHFPLWAWYHWQGTRRDRPDLRASGRLVKGAPGVRIEFELSENRVLLSDFDAWHCVLDRCFLSLQEQEQETFATDLKRAGLQPRWPYPEPFHS